MNSHTYSHTLEVPLEQFSQEFFRTCFFDLFGGDGPEGVMAQIIASGFDDEQIVADSGQESVFRH